MRNARIPHARSCCEKAVLLKARVPEIRMIAILRSIPLDKAEAGKGKMHSGDKKLVVCRHIESAHSRRCRLRPVGVKRERNLGPRELQRCFHDLHAGDRDQAIAGLKRAGRVVENGAGQLEAAA